MTDDEYWDRHYRAGGISGAGSIGLLRDQKWAIIESHVGIPQDVIDVGCGDLSFWEGRYCERYTGIDISPTVQKTNKIERPYWNFATRSADVYIPDLAADVVFCNDLLFHILDESVYREILVNLCNYSRGWIFIYTWAKNPWNSWRSRLRTAAVLAKHGKILEALPFIANGAETDGSYQKYRDFEEYQTIFTSMDFERIAVEQTPGNLHGAMYVFRVHT